jgi:hypothetical protein
MKFYRFSLAMLFLCSLAACTQTDEPPKLPPPAPVSPPGYIVILPDGVPERPEFAAGEIGSRWYAGSMPVLLPRPDYGPLYPYVGAAMSDGWLQTQVLFGLSTADGRTVTDPVYNLAEIIEKDGSAIYMLSRYSGHSRHETTFAALDGSWAVTYQDNSLRRSMLDPGLTASLMPNLDYIPVYNGSGWGAIDYNGNEAYPCRERFPVLFCEGLAAVWNTDGTEYHYIDIQGRTVLGPFESPHQMMDGAEEMWRFETLSLHFSHGLARFYQDGLWGYIDTAGNVVIEPQYWHSSAFYGAYAIIVDAGYTFSAIDREGNVLITADNGHILPLDETFFIAYGFSGATFMSAAGEPVELSINAWSRLRNGWFLDTGSDFAELEKDGEVIVLPFRVSDGLPGDRFIVWFYEDDTAWWGVVDKTGSLLADTREGSAWIAPSGRIQIYKWEENTPLYGLWDAGLTPILPLRYHHLAEYGDYFAVREGYFGGLKDINGNWVVRRSLLDSMMD